MHLWIGREFLYPLPGAPHGVVQSVLGLESALTHGGGAGLPPLQFIDVEEIEERQRGGEIPEPGERRNLDADGKSHPAGEGGGTSVVGLENARPGFLWRVQPDLVDQPLQTSEHGRIWRKAGVEVDLVIGAEPLLEEDAIVHHPVEDEQGFATGDPGAKSAHGLGLFDDIRGSCYPSIVCKHHIPALPLTRERAVPAGAMTPSGHEEDHLCSLMTEDASGAQVLPSGGHSRLLWHLVLYLWVGRDEKS